MRAQEAKYPPLSEYMMARDAEIALAKSAAPDNISGHATIKVLTTSGFQTVHDGDNGFVCVVMRGFTVAPTSFMTRNFALLSVSTHKPYELCCRTTNFGQNLGWKARHPTKLPKECKPLTPKGRSRNAPK